MPGDISDSGDSSDFSDSGDSSDSGERGDSFDQKIFSPKNLVHQKKYYKKYSPKKNCEKKITKENLFSPAGVVISTIHRLLSTARKVSSEINHFKAPNVFTFNSP